MDRADERLRPFSNRRRSRSPYLGRVEIVPGWTIVNCVPKLRGIRFTRHWSQYWVLRYEYFVNINNVIHEDINRIGEGCFKLLSSFNVSLKITWYRGSNILRTLDILSQQTFYDKKMKSYILKLAVLIVKVSFNSSYNQNKINERDRERERILFFLCFQNSVQRCFDFWV